MINSINEGTISNSIYKCSLCNTPNHNLIRDGYKLSMFSTIFKTHQYQTYQIINNICNNIENTPEIDKHNYKIGHCIRGDKCMGNRYNLIQSNAHTLQCGETDKDETITNYSCQICITIPHVEHSFGELNIANYFKNKKEHIESLISAHEPGTRIRFHSCGMGMVITEGCWHITCPKCKKSFCWICLATFNSINEYANHRTIEVNTARQWCPYKNTNLGSDLDKHNEMTTPHYLHPKLEIGHIKSHTALINTEFDIIVPPRHINTVNAVANNNATKVVITVIV
jgi:hypothetical protein